MKTAVITRKHLGSIDMSDIYEVLEPIPPKKAKELAGAADVFYNAFFKNIIKRLIYRQMEFIAMKCDTKENLAFARGTINGLILIDEWFRGETNISRDRFSKEEDNDIFPEI